jgi:hypothetical protein
MPASSRPADPSWVTVIGTTLRLWLRRRVLRVPDAREVSTARRAGLVAGIVVIVAVIAAGAVALSLAVAPARPVGAKARPHHRATAPVVTPLQLDTEANIASASAWIAADISQQALVACDPATGTVLAADGFPAAREDVLQPGDQLPAEPAGQPGGASATLLVATQALGTQYGAGLDAAAPVVLASFGTGEASVQVRLVLTGGAAAAQQDAATALAARRSAGRALAKFRHAHMHAAARRQLTAGEVDPRLITVLHRLSAAATVYIMGFGNPAGPPAPGAQAAPLRLAKVDGLVHKKGKRQISELKAVLKLLNSQHPPYQAQLQVTRLASGRLVLSVWFAAPSPY